MLEIKNLQVSINGKVILKDINLHVPQGETHVLLGPNGTGKTALLMAVIGIPVYQVEKGDILFQGERINDLPPNERAQRGLGIAFQRPPTFDGLSLHELLQCCFPQQQSEIMTQWTQRLRATELLERDLNRGFSGGEIKRTEILQLLAQRPQMVLLDEPESGVDLENIELLGGVINEMLQKELPPAQRSVSGLIITHTGLILDYVNADLGYIMLDRSIKCKGNPRDLFYHIREHGFDPCMECRIEYIN